jgi:hypothetical protein
MTHWVLVDSNNNICSLQSGSDIFFPAAPSGQTAYQIDQATFDSVRLRDKSSITAGWDPDAGEVYLTPVSSGVAKANAWAALRKKRNGLLAATDKTQTGDFPNSDMYSDYRQALRDLPANTTDPANPTWPTLDPTAQGYLSGTVTMAAMNTFATAKRAAMTAAQAAAQTNQGAAGK